MAKRTRVPVQARRVPSGYEIVRDRFGRPVARRPIYSRRAPEPLAERPEGEPASQTPPRRPTSAAGAPVEVAKVESDDLAATSVSDREAETSAPIGDASAPTAEEAEDACAELDQWRDRALRLQAEIDNFRKRQQRLSEERVRDDRERLLRAFLGVADDLERALKAEGGGAGLREGVELTHREFLKLLEREGVEAIEALGKPFDPEWHEGLATVSHAEAGVRPNTVVQVVETGYRIGDRLLRPSRVIVAA
jgi:molecular chaperone GrpE